MARASRPLLSSPSIVVPLESVRVKVRGGFFFLFFAYILSCGFVDYVLITYLTARMAARSEKFTKEVRDVQR